MGYSLQFSDRIVVGFAIGETRRKNEVGYLLSASQVTQIATFLGNNAILSTADGSGARIFSKNSI